ACGTASTLNDTMKTWASNAYAPSATTSYVVKVIAGTSSGQALNISGNSTTQLTLSGSWGTPPDTTSLYLIYRNEGFTLTAANKLGYQRGSGVYNPIADNITSLAFSQPNSNSVTIALNGRTSNPDPHTGLYNSYNLTDTVWKRNSVEFGHEKHTQIYSGRVRRSRARLCLTGGTSHWRRVGN